MPRNPGFVVSYLSPPTFRLRTGSASENFGPIFLISGVCRRRLFPGDSGLTQLDSSEAAYGRLVGPSLVPAASSIPLRVSQIRTPPRHFLRSKYHIYDWTPTKKHTFQDPGFSV